MILKAVQMFVHTFQCHNLLGDHIGLCDCVYTIELGWVTPQTWTQSSPYEYKHPKWFAHLKFTLVVEVVVTNCYLLAFHVCSVWG